MNLLTTAQVAALLGVSVRTVHRMVAADVLTPTAKAPGQRGAYLFDGDTIEVEMIRLARSP